MNFSAGSSPGVFGRFQMLLTVDEDILGGMCDSIGEGGMETGVSVENADALIEGAGNG